MTKTLIVPGLDGSPAPHWQDWWARTDLNAAMIDLPAPHRPVRAAWEAALAVAIIKNPGSILVGHSLGSVVIAQMLATWPGLPVRAAVLVAPASPQGSDRLKDFGALPRVSFDVPTVVVASHNDPWMTFDEATDLSEHWGSTLIDLGNAGHVNVASGFGPWPGGKLIRDSLIDQTARPGVIRKLTVKASGWANSLRN
ncbi:alpha/beta hydrolase [Paracoccus caeni]|uniref:Alpha/beta hydrolase n=1 Tax=Paracoccus caeni TaxID=657651 RepID=A0A934SDA4_9RHOB|nr:alpha/beta hydrolase [Paracoccus caeni]MBK4214811.1 alpha/beta hydrolase [Paracoccus caeni]